MRKTQISEQRTHTHHTHTHHTHHTHITHTHHTYHTHITHIHTSLTYTTHTSCTHTCHVHTSHTHITHTHAHIMHTFQVHRKPQGAAAVHEYFFLTHRKGHVFISGKVCEWWAEYLPISDERAFLPWRGCCDLWGGSRCFAEASEPVHFPGRKNTRAWCSLRVVHLATSMVSTSPWRRMAVACVNTTFYYSLWQLGYVSMEVLRPLAIFSYLWLCLPGGDRCFLTGGQWAKMPWGMQESPWLHWVLGFIKKLI